jgi:hypothetical protein
LFKRKSDAVNALNWWLQGVTHCTLYNDDEAWHLLKMEHRKAEEMEVVLIFLTEVSIGKNNEFDPLYTWRVNNASVEAHRM